MRRVLVTKRRNKNVILSVEKNLKTLRYAQNDMYRG